MPPRWRVGLTRLSVEQLFFEFIVHHVCNETPSPRESSSMNYSSSPDALPRERPARRALLARRASEGGHSSHVSRSEMQLAGIACAEWVREWAIPLPPRCRERVSSLYLPACLFQAPGDSMASASWEASRRPHRRRGVPDVSQEDNSHVAEVLLP